MQPAMLSSDPTKVLGLKALAHKYPTVDAAACEEARLAGRLTRRTNTVHLLSDVHGAHVKLRHILSNGSGALQHELHRSFGAHMSRLEIRQLQKVIQYPLPMLNKLKTISGLFSEASGVQFPQSDEHWPDTLTRIAARMVDVIRFQAMRASTVQLVVRAMPADFKSLLMELVFGLRVAGAAMGPLTRPISPVDQPELSDLPVRPLSALILEPYLKNALDALNNTHRLARFVRHAAHMIRDLSVSEVILVGDLYDRGPRADLCVENLISLPAVTITWGNHDIAWMGAWMGQQALIAFVLRVSCRYNNLAQLDEGYSISLVYLREFAQKWYRDDPCPQHQPKRKDVRQKALVVMVARITHLRTMATHPLPNTTLQAKMHKAIAIIQYKLDAQTIARNPVWGVSNRTLLEGVDLKRGVVTVEGKEWYARHATFCNCLCHTITRQASP
jgi:fructose-1,6-bisphosphatase-3